MSTAIEQPGLVVSMKTATDLSSAQYHFVKLSADMTVALCDAVTDAPLGILQNAPTSGQTAEVMVNGVSKVVVGTGVTLTYGEIVGPDTAGEADDYVEATDVTSRGCGRVLQGAGAAELATVLIECSVPHQLVKSGT